MLESYYYSSINELTKLVRAKKVSPVEIVHACLKRIKEFEPKLNAFITVLADQALEQAKDTKAEIQAGKWRGSLHGIPVGIKDFYDTAGIKKDRCLRVLQRPRPHKRCRRRRQTKGGRGNHYWKNEYAPSWHGYNRT
jgi:Asp-tRNA(Asn)/Glu-tRNA(Gln) amidotransferase A subunit family amidase